MIRLSKISTRRIEMSWDKGSEHQFILGFTKMVEQFNELGEKKDE